MLSNRIFIEALDMAFSEPLAPTATPAKITNIDSAGNVYLDNNTVVPASKWTDSLSRDQVAEFLTGKSQATFKDNGSIKGLSANNAQLTALASSIPGAIDAAKDYNKYKTSGMITPDAYDKLSEEQKAMYRFNPEVMVRGYKVPATYTPSLGYNDWQLTQANATPGNEQVASAPVSDTTPTPAPAAEATQEVKAESTPAPASTPAMTYESGSDAALALQNDIWNGKYGVGQARKDALAKMGYTQDQIAAIQRDINTSDRGRAQIASLNTPKSPALASTPAVTPAVPKAETPVTNSMGTAVMHAPDVIKQTVGLMGTPTPTNTPAFNIEDKNNWITLADGTLLDPRTISDKAYGTTRKPDYTSSTQAIYGDNEKIVADWMKTHKDQFGDSLANQSYQRAADLERQRLTNEYNNGRSHGQFGDLTQDQFIAKNTKVTAPTPSNTNNTNNGNTPTNSGSTNKDTKIPNMNVKTTVAKATNHSERSYDDLVSWLDIN